MDWLLDIRSDHATKAALRALEDHLHDPEIEDYWNRVYDALGGVFGYRFTRETDG